MAEGGGEMASLPVPDELLAEIFLRLPTPADLVRASSGCVSFRRVAAHRSFVRRFRKLHATPLLGFLDGTRDFHPAVAPYPSASAARAVARAADFRFSFLPARARGWAVEDMRDGRVLLDSAETDEVVFTEMALCDPLHRRYLSLPPIPDDLAASVEEEPEICCEAFLVPPGDEEAAAAEETSFRVIWMAQCETKLFAFVFSSSTAKWRVIPSQRWNDLIAGSHSSAADALFCNRQYSCGCFYWRTHCDAETNMLVLDTRRMEFSITEPPQEARCSYGYMVEAGENRPAMFVLTGGVLDGYNNDGGKNDGGSSSAWQKEKTISVGSGHYLIGSTERYLLLYKLRIPFDDSGFYILDVETFQLEKICDAPTCSLFKLRAYSNFPPSLLSLPTISSGAEEEAEEMLVQGCAAS